MNIKFPNNVLYPSPLKSPKRRSRIRHQLGNIYLIADNPPEPVYCVLAQVDFGVVVLICLENHTNRWAEPVAVEDTRKISQKEFIKICNGIKAIYIGRLEDVLKIIPSKRPEDVLINRIFGEEK